MGLNIKDLIIRHEISLKDLKGKVLVVDSCNILYQFLSTIRSIDGTMLTDKQGRVTSHLIGLFNRTTSLMEHNIKLAFVFDGTPPKIKQKTWDKRKEVKTQAAQNLTIAREAGDLTAIRKYAIRTAVLTKDMITDAKKVITALGLPIVQAPSEGEAQAAYMVKQQDAYAVVSQDYDNLIFNSPLLIRNLSIAGKRKKTGTLAYQTIKPQLINLQEVLDQNKLTLDQLIILTILIGTDYNPGGIKGIGPRKALKLLQEHGTDYQTIFDKVEWEKNSDIGWQEIYNTIKDIPVTNDYSLEWKKIDEPKLKHLLIEEFEFSEQRVLSKLTKLKDQQQHLQQRGLKSFFT